MISVFYVSSSPRHDIEKCWASFGIVSSHFSRERLLDLLEKLVAENVAITDAIVMICDQRPDRAHDDGSEPFTATVGEKLAYRLRGYPESVCMMDGRKWRRIPIVVLAPEQDASEAQSVSDRLWDEFPVFAMAPQQYVGGDQIVGAAPDRDAEDTQAVLDRMTGDSEGIDIRTATLSVTDDFSARTIAEAVRAYRQRLLSDLDNLGYMVTFERGRYRVGPALRPKDQLAGYYYYGPGDRRRPIAGVVTVDRDALGVQIEVDEFEALINDPEVSEDKIQEFFEKYPHFLSEVAEALPHVRITNAHGRLIIPDFILKPRVAIERDSSWEMLELKLPQENVLVRKAERRRFSAKVHDGLTQIRDYADLVRNPENSALVRSALGHSLQSPKLGLIIGRLRKGDVQDLEKQQTYVSDVKITTYDEILEQQKTLIVYGG